MTQLSASDLRALATVLDRMGEIEAETGIAISGSMGMSGGVTMDGGDVLTVQRRPVPDSDVDGQYVIEIEG